MEKPNDTIIRRLALLREWMRRENLSAFIVPSSDPHMSEYVAHHWLCRQWVSGFDGSAGTVVVTMDKAGLWTDSRYFLQAEEQLRGTSIRLFRMGLPSEPDFCTWLCGELRNGDAVGIDGSVFSVCDANNLRPMLKQFGVRLAAVDDPFTKIWTDRPSIPQNKVEIHDIRYAGESVLDKIKRVREAVREQGADALFVSALDEIAWLLNIRGTDVDYNPVAISYLFVGRDEVVLFVDKRKLTDDVAAYLQESGVTVASYEGVSDYFSKAKPQRILIDPAKNSLSVQVLLGNGCIIEKGSPISRMKARKNETEIQGFRDAMRRDGVALVRFLMWLEKSVPQGHESELSVSRKLSYFRSLQEKYRGDSFSTIAGYAEHGAIVHYEVTPDTDAALKSSGFLLLDSGAQYLDGTTDITRTIPLGEVSEEAKDDYTLVLKGHIDLAMAHFPTGTRGTQLDVLARLPLWKRNMNYLHGTGHGVGHYLNVHEGPQAIRMNDVPAVLEAGMVTSNEPGVYKSGVYGIRIENLMLVKLAGRGDFCDFFQFDTLTLCPICTDVVKKELLTEDEVEWLNAYHQTVFRSLAPLLEEHEVRWLSEKTRPI